MLIGKFVTLRIMEKSDIEMIRKWKNSPDNYNYFANRDFISDSRQEKWFASKSTDPSGIYLIIINNKTNKPIGMTLLESLDHRNRNACWGIYIADTKFRKRIYAVESVILLFNYAFDYLNLYKIYGNTLKNNLRGRKFHKFIGFSEEAIFHKHVFVDGDYTDLIWISLFISDWEKKENELIEFINSSNIDDVADNIDE